jgi:hypothetical protein
MARWRLVAVLRRWAIVALTLALLLAVPGRLSAGLPAWIIAGGPAVLLVAGVALGARRPPSLATVARVLDHHLALKEQLASALALSGSADAHGPLGARLEVRAAALIGRTRREWTARPAFAGGEWVVLVAASAALALLLVAPRAGSSRPAALATGGAPAAQTFATLPSRAHLPVHMRVAVVSTPPAGTSVRQPIPGSRVQPRRQGAQVVPTQGAGRTQQSRGQEAPGTRSGAAAAGGTTASSSQQHGKLSLVSGRPNSPPTVRGRNGARSGRGGQRRSAAGSHGPFQAAQRGRAGGAGQRASSPASGASGHAQPGTIPRGKGLRSPYGGPLPGIGVRQKPGLVIGRALYAGSAHGRGSNSAGHGRAPLGGPSAARPLRATGGHQLSLQSAYGGAPGQGSRSGPTAPSGQRGNTAHVVSGQSEVPATDYIPPDANAVAPGDRAVVAGYFTPRSTS